MKQFLVVLGVCIHLFVLVLVFDKEYLSRAVDMLWFSLAVKHHTAAYSLPSSHGMVDRVVKKGKIHYLRLRQITEQKIKLQPAVCHQRD